MNSGDFGRVAKFILDALNPDPQLPLPIPLSQTAHWDELLRLTRVHRLGPLLARRLARDDVASAVPEPVLAELLDSRRRHALRNLNLYRELVTVTRMLGAAGISSIALKGAYLARFAYPDPGLRPMRDLDLLLRPEQAVAAFELLRAAGYQAMFDGSPEAYFADRKHLPPLTGPSGISIELHHRLTYPASHLEFQAGLAESLWSESIAKDVGGAQISFLCPEHLLLHLCIHATMEHLLNTGPLALADLAWLIETHPIDWQRFLDIVSGGNWQRCVLPLLFLAARHLKAQVPESVIRELGGGRDDEPWLAAAQYLLFSDPEDHKLLDFGVQDLLYSQSLSRRLAALAGAVFPPREVLARHYHVSAASPAAYLYYPARWYQLLTKKLPLLLAANSGRKPMMRELARQRNALGDWLRQNENGQ